MRWDRAAVAILAVAACVMTLTTRPVAAQAPANDAFPGLTIPSVNVTQQVDTRGASAQPGEPFGANQVASVWYNYTPPADTNVFVALENATAPAFFNVYTGESLATLVEVASGGTSFRTTFRARGGERLAFQVGPVFAFPDGGTLTLLIHSAPPPLNDLFPGATITTLPFYDAVDTHFATVDRGEPSILAGTVWYSFTAPERMTVAADTWESNFIAGFALVTADTMDIPGGSDRGTHDLCDGGRVASRVFTIEAGEHVWFQVGGRGPQPAERGRLVFNVTRLEDGATSNPRCRESDPNHPLQVHFGPLPSPIGLALPDLAGATTVTGQAAVLARLPAAGRLAPADAAGLSSATAEIAPSGSFFASFLYNPPGGRQITVQSWTKTGDFQLVVPAASPVIDVQQTYLTGIPVVTVLTSTNVVGPGQNHVWAVSNGIIYSFEFEGYGFGERAEVRAISERALRFLLVTPPATGSGLTAESTGSGHWLWASLAVVTVVVGTGGWAWSRAVRQRG
jgi:hypothetical protein